MRGYAVTLTRRGDYRHAEKLLRDLLVRYQAAVGRAHPDTINLVLSMAAVYMWQRKPECLVWYDRAIAEASEFVGAARRMTVTAWIGSAGCFIGQSRPKAAVRAAQQALRISESAPHGRCEAMEAAAECSLADAHRCIGNHREAELAYVRALGICAVVNCYTGGLHLEETILAHYAELLHKLDRRPDLRNVENRLKRICDSRPSSTWIVDIQDLNRR